MLMGGSVVNVFVLMGLSLCCLRVRDTEGSKMKVSRVAINKYCICEQSTSVVAQF